MQKNTNAREKNKCPVPKGWHGFCLAVAFIFPLQKPCQKGLSELMWRYVNNAEVYEVKRFEKNGDKLFYP